MNEGKRLSTRSQEANSLWKELMQILESTSKIWGKQCLRVLVAMLTGYATVAGHDDIIRRERSTLLVHDVRIGCVYHCLVQGVLEPLSLEV